jgi:hypothetical protein
LETVAVPRCLLVLGEGCFKGLGIRVLDLRRTRVVRIAPRAFHSCRALSVLILPRELRTLGYLMLEGSGLGRLDLWGTLVARIEEGTFMYAMKLREVVFPRVMEWLCDSLTCRELWCVTINPDRLISGGGRLAEVTGLRRLCLHGAAWWGGCRACTGAMVFSGCSGAAGQLARPLLACA